MASIVRPTLLRQAFNAAPQLAPLSLRAAPLAAKPLGPSFVRSALPRASRVAAFHATARRPILPALPQKIEGSVNEPAPVPRPSHVHGSYHWTFERLISVGLIPLTVAPFAAGSLNPALDATLCALLLAHSHIGFQACIIDYFPKRRIPGAHKAAMWLLNLCTVLVGVSLYQFETNDVGVTEAVKRIWHA